MKVIFLLDNNEYVEVDPTNLQLRQLAPGQAALGLNVVVPVRNEDGTPKLGENGQPQTAVAYRPLVNYAVDLVVPAPPVPPVPPEPPALAPAATCPACGEKQHPGRCACLPPTPPPAPVETPASTPASAAPTKAKRLKKKSRQ